MSLLETLLTASTMISVSVLVALLTRDYSKTKRRATTEYNRASSLATAFVSELDRRVSGVHQSYEILQQELEECQSAVSKLEAELAYVRSNKAPNSEVRELRSQQEKITHRLQMTEESVSRFRTVMSITPFRAPPAAINEGFTPQFSRLNATERKILEILKEGKKTYKEIQQQTDLSREHVSRQLKRLFDLGFVERDETVRPYEYRSLLQMQQEK